MGVKVEHKKTNIAITIVFICWGVFNLPACKKDNTVFNQEPIFELTKPGTALLLPSEERLESLYFSKAVLMGLIANADRGEYWSAGMTFGPLSGGVQVKVSDMIFDVPEDTGISYGVQDFDLLSLFGKEHVVSITTPEQGEQQYNLYIPELIKGKIKKEKNDWTIPRTGNKITWNKDSKHPTKIVLDYELFRDVGRLNTISFSGKILEDNGHYNLDTLIADKVVKSISFSLYRLNALGFETNDKKIALAFTAVDHHGYRIED